MQEQPTLTLQFYSYGVMMQKRTDHGLMEYPVDPEQIALALSAKVIFDTGILSGETLLVRSEGVKKVVVEYRAPQRTGLYLDGSEAPLRVPLPGLVLIRTTTENRNPQYAVYAVKKRPVSLDAELFHAPLPNIYAGGNICWGSVHVVSDSALAGTSLAEDWKALLGTPFNDHGVAGKSKQYPRDVRQMFIALETAKKRVYPKRDLVATQKTLREILGGADT